ncbi:hypothetical protein ACQVP2_27310 [Methylobacterium aquaticum]|uniref:hypothetical protein n=1 Tax=Methylobacterium aquaticum TaxID=270351 RepID=UPI003D166534
MGGPSAPALTAAMVQDAVAQMLPQPAIAAPPAAGLDGRLGTTQRFALEDHTHAVRVQRMARTTAADGTLTWVFARPIVVTAGDVPPLAYMVEDTGSPVVVQVVGRTLTTAGGQDTHTAVTVRAQRSRTLPATLVSLAGLVGFDIFQVAANVRVNLWAADPTQ